MGRHKKGSVLDIIVSNIIIFGGRGLVHSILIRLIECPNNSHSFGLHITRYEIAKLFLVYPVHIN